MSTPFGKEKLSNAVRSLCGQGSLSDRLVNSVIYSLEYINPEVDLPKEIQSEFKIFMEKISSVSPQGDEGSIRATVDTFDQDDLISAVEKIIVFYETFSKSK